MRRFVLAAVVSCVGLAPGGALGGDGLSRDQYVAGEQRIEAEHAAVRASCDRQAVGARVLCLAAASDARDVARAELLLALEPSLAHAHAVRLARAEAAYDLALQRCDDQAAGGGNGCVLEAKSARVRALAQARMAHIEATALANEQAFDAGALRAAAGSPR